MNNPFGTLRNAESMDGRMGRARKNLTCAATHQFANYLHSWVKGASLKQTQPVLTFINLYIIYISTKLCADSRNALY